MCFAFYKRLEIDRLNMYNERVILLKVMVPWRFSFIQPTVRTHKINCHIFGDSRISIVTIQLWMKINSNDLIYQ